MTIGDDLEKFWDFVDKKPETGECWNWIGPRNAKTGHGYLTLRSRQQSAHRVAYQLSHGPIPIGMIVMHTCNNPLCCNPAHVELGTRADQRARYSRSRQPDPSKNGT